MSGVWLFHDGVMKLENPEERQPSDDRRKRSSKFSCNKTGKMKELLHIPTGQVVKSYVFLEQILMGLGWERYYGGDGDLIQFHKYDSIDLISLPRDFSRFNSIYMYDIVVKTPNVFHVRDN
ncbi:flowering-promoting factor 1-like protein 2 [Impatiens glandulifera]|uniref:flowering-promoting factor 1-like protein 2 n=1 Tax=Impatiens glandulifera TaxID=253017 RepID=UPI001FB14045|nr:flowering-promoting factor 1-like protein 2 [Impatiens glandulifera]XP_047340514.1 flowering-promoting factor 1-like protein 2 [Impatiens glandulifera]